jgi:hypothetical protein
MADITNSRVSSPLPEILFEEECGRLLATASSDPRTYLLFIETGIKLEDRVNGSALFPSKSSRDFPPVALWCAAQIPNISPSMSRQTRPAPSPPAGRKHRP